jgi:hypothetical protein
MTMTKNVLLLGVRKDLIPDFAHQISMSDIQLFTGTGIDDVRSVFGQTHIDHVIIGGGIDLKTRVNIIQEVYHSSDKTTMHMKDQISGPEGFVPFARAVLSGMKDYEFVVSPNARSEISTIK